MTNLLDSFTLPATVLGVVVLIIALIVLWAIVSIPVYAAGRLVTGGKASFGQAMGATLGGALFYLIVLYAASFFLGVLLGPVAAIFAVLLALIAWLGVYRASFDTGWLGAFGIVIVAWIVLVILDFLLVGIFGIALPKFYPF